MKNTITNLRAVNRRAEQVATDFRAAYQRDEKTFLDFSKIKNRYPFHGFVRCDSGDLSWVLFSAADDIVAMQFFWLGPDGYEKETLELWKTLCAQANCILDVGGYTGMMSIVAAMVNENAKIHYFGPMERIVERAQINFRINGIQSKIQVHPVAVSNKAGALKINLYRPDNFLGTGSSLSEKPGKEVITEKLISTVSLDPIFFNEKIDIVKLDVEGHEIEALHGMRNIIQRDRPKVIVEVWPHEETELMDFFRQHEYKLERLDGIDGGVCNYFAMPV